MPAHYDSDDSGDRPSYASSSPAAPAAAASGSIKGPHAKASFDFLKGLPA